jgi:hypothetical protein
MADNNIVPDSPRESKSNAEIVESTATDPTEKDPTSKSQCEEKKEDKQERLLEDISAEKETTAANIDGATGSDTQTQKKGAGFRAVFERNLRDMLRWVTREQSTEVAKPEKENRRVEGEVTMGIYVEPQESNDNKPTLKVDNSLQRVHERPEYAEFTAEYLAYIRRGGFRY